MKINKIYIQNFGKLQNLEIDLNEGLNQFFYENGYGKTTLSIFLKTMLYGMPPSRDNIKMERKRYSPWQGGTFGGYIEFEWEQKQYRLTRNFAKTPEGDFCELLDLKTNRPIDLQGREVGEILFGVGKDTFQTTAFFPQLNFGVSPNQETSANILGLDKFKYDLANLNTAISQIKKKLTEVKREKADKTTIERLRNDLQNKREIFSQQQSRLQKLSREMAEEREEVGRLADNAQQTKKEFDFHKQRYESKQKLENQLHQKQEEANQILTSLNQTQPKEKQNINIWIIAMTILGLLGIVCCGILGACKIITLPVMLAILALSVACSCTGLVLTIKQKKGKSLTCDLQQTELKNSLSLCNQQIAVIKESLQAYQNCTSPEYDVVEKLNDALFDKKIIVQDLQKEYNILSNQIEKTNEEIDLLSFEIAQKEEDLANSTKKIQLLTLAKDFLLKASENVSSRFVEPANVALQEILQKFEIRNRQFVIDNNFDVKEISLSGIKEKEYSSQGYQDILSFCTRIYLLKEIYKNERPFVVLDDTFVNLDDENMKKAGEFLKELANEYQIIYLCCNSRCKID